MSGVSGVLTRVASMRFLHTSDWHLGRTFHGSSLLEEQRRAMDRVVDAVSEHGVDAVLVPGDIYDRALPAVEVVQLLDRTLARIVEAGAVVVMTSGNHDSAVRLGFGAALMERGGVHLRTDLGDLTRPVVMDNGAEDLLIYGIPYLEPRLVAERLGLEAGAGHSAVVAAAMEAIRQDAAHRAQGSPRPTRTLVLAHLFAAGGEGSESERPLSVGEVDRVPATVFSGVDYAALGHLHGPQAPLPTVRYSGSPLPYSFSEAEQSKVGLLVDVVAGEQVRVSEIVWPPPRPLRRLRGRLDELLSDPVLENAEEAWCQFTLTDAERPARPMERLRERFPHALVLQFDPQGRRDEERLGYRDRLRRAEDPTEVSLGFVEHVRGRGADGDEAALVRELVHAAETVAHAGADVTDQEPAR